MAIKLASISVLGVIFRTDPLSPTSSMLANHGVKTKEAITTLKGTCHRNRTLKSTVSNRIGIVQNKIRFSSISDSLTNSLKYNGTKIPKSSWCIAETNSLYFHFVVFGVRAANTGIQIKDVAIKKVIVESLLLLRLPPQGQSKLVCLMKEKIGTLLHRDKWRRKQHKKIRGPKAKLHCFNSASHFTNRRSTVLSR